MGHVLESSTVLSKGFGALFLRRSLFKAGKERHRQ